MTVSRRNFLKLSGTAAAGSAALVFWRGGEAAQQPPDTGRVTLDYPRTDVGKAADLPVGEQVAFSYPDSASPCAVVRTGERVAGGVGPDGDIVAYSVLCTHMGCPVQYERSSGVFRCPCHFSLFDPTRRGQQVCGQATVDLPQIRLVYDEASDTITAVGVDGLIYGRQANIL